MSLVGIVTDDLIKSKNFHAGEFIKKVAELADGSGGGRPQIAIAGSKNISKQYEVKDCDKVRVIIRSLQKK